MAMLAVVMVVVVIRVDVPIITAVVMNMRGLTLISVSLVVGIHVRECIELPR